MEVVFLHGEKNKTKTKVMEERKFKYRRLPDMAVELNAQEDTLLTVLRGKAVLNEEGRHMIFMQNEPRGPRSREIYRAGHGILRRRPDGGYTITVRFGAEEKMLLPTIVAEARNMVKEAIKDAAQLTGMKSKEEGDDLLHIL